VTGVLTDPDIWWPPNRIHAGLCFYSYSKHVAAEESIIQASAPDDVTRIFTVYVLQLIYFFASELTDCMDLLHHFMFDFPCIIS
jgi:hypothetical protein